MKSALFLFILGVLICSPLSTQKPSHGTVVLTETNHVLFSGQVTESSVAAAQIKLGQLSASLDDNDVIYLVLDTPGGSVMAGNQFIDFAKSLPQTIKPVSLFAASMGYHMFQSFGTRIMQPSSTIMSHRVALGGLSGQVPGELITRLNAIIIISNNMDDVAAKRVGLSREAYQKLIHDELWLDGISAVKSGHADVLAKLRCSKELIQGVRFEEVETIFGPVKVKFSKCPLISGFLSFEFSRKNVASNSVSFPTPRSRDEVVAEIKKAKRKVTTLGIW